MFIERKEVSLWAEILEAMFSEQISTELISFFILYGITGVVPLLAAAYLLLRKGNAFAPDVTPPMRLRRWAASFFIISAWGHVLWFLFMIYSSDIHSAAYVVVAEVDGVGMLTTVAGTLLAMLQDRKRPVWPVVAALIPYMAIGALYIACHDDFYLSLAIAYILLLFVLFTIYVVLAVRQYGRWLRDNYADLERKEVWQSQVLLLVFMLLFILYALVDTNTFQVFLLHIVELLLFSLLLWRVETLPQLENSSMESAFFEPLTEEAQVSGPALAAEEMQETNSSSEGRKTSSGAIPSGQRTLISTVLIQQLLDERCVGTQLYLQHDLTLQQLATAIGINRYYLSQFFSSHGMTYNAYINDLRINQFVYLYREAVAVQKPITAQQLASESGYRSYSTFSLAFKQRMGQSVTSWMRENG